DHLRDGIGLRGYGQKDPKREYAREGFEMFQQMLALFRQEVVRRICLVEPRVEAADEEIAALEQRMHASGPDNIQLQHASQGGYGVADAMRGNAAPVPAAAAAAAGGAGVAAPPAPPRPSAPRPSQPLPGTPTQAPPASAQRVGRNDPCPCGSGKKYKKCHYPEFG
ncbi:MAG: hypothetical protein D6761_08975, partial [Candidatus Dadabacteria bacterium]